jgi:SAM-dependent methyltransferase
MASFRPLVRAEATPSGGSSGGDSLKVAAMRRATLPLLRCPACLSGPLEADDDRPVIDFGPVRCGSCGTAWPMAEGILDLLGEPTPAPPLAARLLTHPLAARTWERGVRTAALGLVGTRLDPEGESLLVRSLLGAPPGAPVAEIAAFTATHARRLALLPGAGPVIAFEAFRPMLEEALHQIREAGAPVDLVRAAPDSLPLRDGVLGGAVWVGSLHLVADPARVLGEVARCLAPGARLVCGTRLPGRLPVLGRLGRADLPARLFGRPRSEAELRELCARAGLGAFEIFRLPPAVFLRVERTGTSAV